MGKIEGDLYKKEQGAYFYVSCSFIAHFNEQYDPGFSMNSDYNWTESLAKYILNNHRIEKYRNVLSGGESSYEE